MVQDVQNQAVASGFIEVFEIELPDSNIGGHGIDRLYFHNGATGTQNISWYSPINLDNQLLQLEQIIVLQPIQPSQ